MGQPGSHLGPLSSQNHPKKALSSGPSLPEEKLMETDSTLAKIEPTRHKLESQIKSRGGEQAESYFRKEFTIIKLAKIIEDGTL